MRYFTLFLLICSGQFLFAQEVKNPTIADTSKFEIKVNSFSLNEVKYELIDVNKFVLSDLNLLKMKSKTLTVNLEENNGFEFKSGNLLNPLYNQYMQEQKYAIWRTILGSVQMGAVGYLAYKHIKKYGFK